MPSNEELDIILHTKGFQYRSCWECNKAHKQVKPSQESNDLYAIHKRVRNQNHGKRGDK